ncbi:unnamed protein product [Heligmosomoides polygyrus]|uniref:Uncharacterized protein n=1 Tax=Heligmosomoides polygyrus TaxID=6339 RepID=A0A183GU08_HELPZ|nr:unnamed protein product [Heligmosomoides polygyrus]
MGRMSIGKEYGERRKESRRDSGEQDWREHSLDSEVASGTCNWRGDKRRDSSLLGVQYPSYFVGPRVDSLSNGKYPACFQHILDSSRVIPLMLQLRSPGTPGNAIMGCPLHLNMLCMQCMSSSTSNSRSALMKD